MVEVWQGTPWIAGRSWTRTTRRQEDEENEEEEEEEEKDEEEEKRKEEETTDIKSNNPHLAGGEKHVYFSICFFR